jgi:hypothetical protein
MLTDLQFELSLLSSEGVRNYEEKMVIDDTITDHHDDNDWLLARKSKVQLDSTGRISFWHLAWLAGTSDTVFISVYG